MKLDFIDKLHIIYKTFKKIFETHLYFKLLVQSISANFFVLVSSLISSALLAHLLGPRGRGELGIILLWPMLFVSLGTLGLEKAIAYYCGKFRNKVNEIFFTGWLLLFFLSIFVFFLGYNLLPYILKNKEIELIKTTQFSMILVPIMFIGNLPYWVLHGLGELKLWNIVRCIHIWLWILGIFFAYLTKKATPFFLAKIYILTMAINCSIWLIIYFFSVKGSYKINFKLIPDLIKYGIFSLLSNISAQLNIRLDQLIMSILLLPQELGLYIIAVQWSGVLSPIMLGFSQIAFPKMISSQIGDRLNKIFFIIKYSSLIGFFIVTILIILTPFLLPLVFGEKFKGAIISAIILIVANFISGINTIFDEIVKGLGMPFLSSISQFIGLIVNLILIFPLIKYLGILGASVLSVICYSVVLFTIVLNLKKRFSFRLIELFPQKNDLMYLKSMFIKFAKEARWRKK